MSFLQTPPQVAPLPEMPCGCKLRVEELGGSPSLRSKLYAMGILPGTEMELCHQACGRGSVCVRVRCCSVVLSECLAKSIFCRAAGDSISRRGRWPWLCADRSDAAAPAEPREPKVCRCKDAAQPDRPQE